MYQKKTFGHIVGFFSVLWYFDIAYPKKETKIKQITFSNHEETKIILSRLGALYFFHTLPNFCAMALGPNK